MSSEQNIKMQHPHLSTNLVFSVFPAPDSPETMMDWLIFRTFMSLYALSAGRATQIGAAVGLDSPLPHGHKPNPNNHVAMTPKTDFLHKV